MARRIHLQITTLDTHVVCGRVHAPGKRVPYSFAVSRVDCLNCLDVSGFAVDAFAERLRRVEISMARDAFKDDPEALRLLREIDGGERRRFPRLRGGRAPTV